MSWWREPLFELAGTPITPLALVALGGTLLATFAVARLVRLALVRALRRGEHGAEGKSYAFGRIAEYLVYLAGGLIALENFGVSLTALAAFGAILSVGIGFGLQNVAQNFVSGVILLVERPVSQGDVVEVSGLTGTVEDIGMRATRVITLDGISVLVPNSKLISDEVRNLHVPTSANRFRVRVGVAYGSDVELVRSTLLEVARDDARVLSEPEPTVLFQDFGDSALEFELAVWIEDAELRPVVASDLRFAIEASFRAREIRIPFPQRDLHVRSGLGPLTGECDRG